MYNSSMARRRGARGAPQERAQAYGQMTRLAVQVEWGQRTALVKASEELDRSMAGLVREAIDDWLRAHGYDGEEKGDGDPGDVD